MKLKEIMTANVKKISPDSSLVEAATLMKEADIGLLPVCNDIKILGMLTDRDLVIRGMTEKRPTTLQSE